MQSYCAVSLRLVVAVVLALPVSAQEPAHDPREPSKAEWVLRFDGIGPVRIGMSLSDLKRTLHNEATEETSGGDACFYVTPTKHPQVGFMIIKHGVVRIDVTDKGVLTSKGIQVGDSESTVKAAYPHLTIGPHAYTAPDGRYLTVYSSDGRLGIRFETYKGKITGFYAGTSEAIQYIEGCN